MLIICIYFSLSCCGVFNVEEGEETSMATFSSWFSSVSVSFETSVAGVGDETADAGDAAADAAAKDCKYGNMLGK